MTTFEVGGRPPGGLRGRVRVPGDKSISHRALLLAARAEGTSIVRGLADGDDVRRTAAAVHALGAVLDGERVTGGAAILREADHVLDVGNSGTTIRLLAGWAAAFPWLTVIEGDPSVARRPMDRVVEPLRLMGATVDGRSGGRYPPLVVRGGGLRGIEYELPVASAQVKSAILLAGLGAEGETVVHEPAPTRRHTEEMLAACGVPVVVKGCSVRLRPAPVQPFELNVPGDPSHAAFWAVAACIVPGSELVLENLYLGPARTGFLEVLTRMGADIRVEGGDLRVRHSHLYGTEVGGADIPALIDEVPVLAVAASLAEGTTTFRDAAELRVKESDRIASVASELAALGARVTPREDGLVVEGAAPLRGARVSSHGDHRIAMAMAVAGLAAAGTTRIEGWEAVATSYPAFDSDLRSVL
jgi:3-phosphoshikimate 1-carboxyvinyltransferase